MPRGVPKVIRGRCCQPHKQHTTHTPRPSASTPSLHRSPALSYVIALPFVHSVSSPGSSYLARPFASPPVGRLDLDPGRRPSAIKPARVEGGVFNDCRPLPKSAPVSLLVKADSAGWETCAQRDDFIMAADMDDPSATDADDAIVVESQTIDFVTMGMFIIDDIEYLPPTPPVKDILGGAGTYSALGARLLSPGPLSTSVGWIVDRGSDFPPALDHLISTWETSALIRDTPDRLTTRGWNGYDEHETRAFKYLTEKKRVTADDLTPELLTSRSFHMVCSPTRCQQLVAGIKKRRSAMVTPSGNSLPKPVFVWEPVPDLCTTDELLNCTNTLPMVDICSPNHSELAGFMGDTGLDPETGEISTAAVERACEQLLASMPLQSFALVVRAGEKGCYLARNGGRKRTKRPTGKRKKASAMVHGSLQLDMDMEALFAGLLQDEEGMVAEEEIEVDPGVERWIPAYHTNKEKVVDPTGGGNTFLGGLAVAMARGKSLEEAAAWASVAASFAIEQVGPPVLGADEEGKETWNGVRVDERFEEFKNRLAFG